MHVNKGKTIAQCFTKRIEYAKNPSKTEDGYYVRTYECDASIADAEFLYSKRQYEAVTGRRQKNNVIAYQIRQSFKPGEIAPELANQIAYDLAMRFTKGNHNEYRRVRDERREALTAKANIDRLLGKNMPEQKQEKGREKH